MAVDPIKYNQLPVLGSLEAGDTVLGEKVNGTTGRLSVGQLQPSDGDKGDITVSGSGLTWIVDNDAITYAKIQNVSATDKLLGRSSSGAGDVEEITCTAAGRNLLDDADASAQRTTLGLGTLATQSGTFSGTSSGTNTGDQTSIVGITGSKSEYNTSCSDGDFLFTDGGTGTGTYDFGGATSFEIPNSATPTVDADGEIAVDTSVTDFSHGILKYYSGEELAVISVPIAQLTSPVNGNAILYNSTADEFQLGTVSSFDPNATAGTDNVVVGTSAGGAIASGGIQNTFVGRSAGAAVTTADNNVAVGYQALDAVTSSAVNATAVGSGALGALTSGSGMCGIGYLAGSAWTTQTDGIAIGTQAAASNTGAGNIAIGTTTMANGTASRANNTIIGHGAGNFGTGSNTVAIGNANGRSHGSDCVFIGKGGTNGGRSGNNNICIGSGSQADESASGTDNIFIGTNCSTRSAVSGTSTAVTMTTGTHNTVIGTAAGSATATTSGAIAIGAQALAMPSTGATSSDHGPGITIGSTGKKVGFRGDGTIYSAVGSSAGYWRIHINGTAYKIQLFADS